MTALDREKQYIRRWRPKAVRGDTTAMSNVAAAYRILENFRLAAKWYRRASEHRDGDALTEWGYCLQHGVGIRRHDRAAERAYRAAIRRAAARLLRIASADGDYPQAEALLSIARSADIGDICVCRRHLRPRLSRRHCPVHRLRRGQQNGAANRSAP
jgi:TPR repeat protein